MSDSDNIKSYSATDIQKYLNGELSPSEMHAIERAAMDDSFLADAIEGMEMTRNEYGDEIINRNLAELNSALEEKSDAARVVAMRSSAWWYAAAAVIIIIGGLFTYNNYNKNTEQLGIIAKGERAKPPAQPTIGPADESSSSYRSSAPPDSAKRMTFANALVVRDGNNLASKNKDFKKTDISQGYTASSEFEADLLTKPYSQTGKDSQYLTFNLSKSEQLNLPPVQLKLDSVSAPQKLEGRVAGVEVDNALDKTFIKKPDYTKDDVKSKGIGFEDITRAQPRTSQEERFGNQTRLNYFQGRVLDNNNQPLPNATVSIVKEHSVVTTDRNGYFNINSRDSQPDANVAVVGYATRKVELSNNAQYNTINLVPDAKTLNEVVVTGYGTQRKKDISATDRSNNGSATLNTKVQDATPVIEWMEYEKYLDKNKKPNGNTKFKTGEVVVSFFVDKKGQLSSFKIEQSLGQPEDTEAVRLIKEGPKWKVTKGKKARATVIIRF